jgi:hypothetical protein
MTAITSASIPTSIDTLERLLAWSALAGHDLNRGLFYKESDAPDGSVPYISAGVVEAADNSDRLILRAAIEMDPAWRYEQTQGLWMYAKQWREVALPGYWNP